MLKGLFKGCGAPETSTKHHREVPEGPASYALLIIPGVAGSKTGRAVMEEGPLAMQPHGKNRVLGGLLLRCRCEPGLPCSANPTPLLPIPSSGRLNTSATAGVLSNAGLPKLCSHRRRDPAILLGSLPNTVQVYSVARST